MAEVADPIHAVGDEDSGAFLASSPMNGRAVAVFLILHLGLPQLPLPVAMRDDPWQNLDDLTLLGRIDQRRRIRAHRQFDDDHA